MQGILLGLIGTAAFILAFVFVPILLCASIFGQLILGEPIAPEFVVVVAIIRS